jgi:hypothetical protein
MNSEEGVFLAFTVMLCHFNYDGAAKISDMVDWHFEVSCHSGCNDGCCQVSQSDLAFLTFYCMQKSGA